MKRGGRLRLRTTVPMLVVLLLAGCSQFSIYDQFRSITSPTSTVGLQISPSVAGLLVGGTEFFTASGGVSPYSFSVLSGGAGGTIVASTGAYTAPNTAGIDTVQVTDANGNITNAKVTAVAVAPLVISPSAVALNAGDSYQFHASGGVPPYTYSLISGSVGTLNSSTGVYTFPASATSSSTASVTVTDSIGITATSAQITCSTAGSLAVSPSTATLTEGASFDFVASSGTPPYTTKITPTPGGTASVNGQVVSFTAGVAGTNYALKVSDSAMPSVSTVTATVNVAPAAPSNLAATVSSGGVVNLSWTNNSAGATGLNVQRAVGNGTYSTIASFTTATAPLPSSYQDTDLSAGTVYVYRIEVSTGSPLSYSNEAVVVAQ